MGGEYEEDMNGSCLDYEWLMIDIQKIIRDLLVICAESEQATLTKMQEEFPRNMMSHRND